MYGALCSLYYDVTEKYATAAELDFYTSFMKPQDRVLEAMSGSGRLQLPLLQRGYTVDGVDSSPHMIDRCRASAQLFNVQPLLYEQRLETMCLEYSYDMTIIAVASFQLIVDPEVALQALQNIHARMHKGGNLFLDIFVPDVSFDPAIRSSYTAYVDDRTTIAFSACYELCQDKQYIDAFCTYELSVDGCVQKREHEHMRLVWYTDEQLCTMLNRAGFAIVDINVQPFRPAGPSRIVQARAC